MSGDEKYVEYYAGTPGELVRVARVLVTSGVCGVDSVCVECVGGRWCFVLPDGADVCAAEGLVRRLLPGCDVEVR